MIDQIGSFLGRDGRERLAQLGGGLERDEAMDLGLKRTDAELDLGDDAGDALGIGYERLQLIARELLDLTGRQHDASGDDVVLEGAVLVAAEPGAALCEPAGNR